MKKVLIIDDDVAVYNQIQSSNRAAAKGESWKFGLMNTIDHAIRINCTKAEFIRNIKQKGFQVKWTDTRKGIGCPAGCKKERNHSEKPPADDRFTRHGKGAAGHSNRP